MADGFTRESLNRLLERLREDAQKPLRLAPKSVLGSLGPETPPVMEHLAQIAAEGERD